MRRLLFFLYLLASAGVVHAHIGSPNVIYEGLAGPYPLRVVIRPPGVVPGLAEISVRVLQGTVSRVTVLPALRILMFRTELPVPSALVATIAT